MDYVIPIITCNAIFYSLTAISTSITSTQNIFKFIIDNKESDYIKWQRQLEATDLYNKLHITYALIKEIIKNNSSIEDVDKVMQELTNSKFKIIDYNDYLLIEFQKTVVDINIPAFAGMPEYIKLSLFSLLDVINKLNNILEKIHYKIIKHQKILFKNFFTININDDIQYVISLTNLFNNRLNLLFDLLKVAKTLN